MKSASYTLVVLAMTAAPRPAAACTYAEPPPALHGVPSDGQQDVPTDVAPAYSLGRLQGAPEDSPGLFSLREAGGDEVTVTTRRIGGNYAELIAASPLRPFTDYVVEAQVSDSLGAPVSLSLTFTTGAGPLARAPDAPAIFGQHFALAPGVEWTSCDLDEGICLALPKGHLYEMSLVGGYVGETKYLLDAPYANTWTGLPGLECFEFRQRAMNGSYSAPVRVCLDDMPSYELAGDASMDCTPDGIVHAGALVTEAPAAVGEATPDAAAGDPGGNGASEATARDATTLAGQAPRVDDGIGCSLRPTSPPGWSLGTVPLAFVIWAARRKKGARARGARGGVD